MTAEPSALASLIAAIEVGQQVPSSGRAAALRETMASPLDVAALKPFSRWEAGKYTRNVLYTGKLWQLLLLCWEPGAHSPIHDHAGGECWLRVVVGSLCATPYVLQDPQHQNEAGAPIDVVAIGPEARLAAGDVDYRDAQQAIHQVRNPMHWQTRAMSLHLYCNRAATCIVYDPSSRTATETAVDAAPVSDS